MSDIPFGVTDWSEVEPVEHKGEYTPGYRADHWCEKGHILLCTEGELHTELRDGRSFTLTPGMSYQVADRAEAHRSSTQSGARLFIVD